MNYNFLCHIIKDVFPKKQNILIYNDIDNATKLRSVMANSEHSMGSFILHTDRSKREYFDEVAYWEIGINSPYVGFNYADLFISINYNPKTHLDDSNDFIAEQIKGVLKNGGQTLLINPGKWASELDCYLKLNSSLIKELKKYSMLSNEKVFVYENI